MSRALLPGAVLLHEGENVEALDGAVREEAVDRVAHVVEEILAVPRSDLKTAPDLPGNISPEWVVGVHDDNRLILRTDQILQDARLVEWRA